MGCFVLGGKSLWDVLSGVAKNGMGWSVGHFPPWTCAPYEKWHMRTSAPPLQAIDIGGHVPPIKKCVGHLPPNQSA